MIKALEGTILQSKSYNLKDRYPCQDLSLTSRVGERWQDIPGLDGRYSISNFGRVKRESFELLCSNGQLRRMRPKIMMADVHTVLNRSLKDHVHWLRVKMMVAGVMHECPIARQVYYSYVKKFDLANYNLVILPKDGDGKNIRPENLVLADLSRKAGRIHERGRVKYLGLTSYEEYRRDGLEKSSNPSCKQVTQYTRLGVKVRTFPSSAAAAAFLQIPVNRIINVLKNRQVSCAGFVWRYGHAPKIDMKTFLANKEEHRKDLVGRKLTQYNNKGRKVATYLTINDAARATGVHASCISEALTGGQMSAGGYIWKEGNGKDRIDLTGYSFGEELRAQRQQIQVKQYSLDGKYVQTFPSVKAAAASVGISAAHLSGVLGGSQTHAAGFIWRKMGKK
jgi:hypothetical protein